MNIKELEKKLKDDINRIHLMDNKELLCRLMLLCQAEGVKTFRCEIDNELVEEIGLMEQEVMGRMGTRNEF
jgi:hypothetical protein